MGRQIQLRIKGIDPPPFEISGIADPVGKGLVGQDAAEALGAEPMGLEISARIGQEAHCASVNPPAQSPPSSTPRSR